jgi:hypothetical protein
MCPGDFAGADEMIKVAHSSVMGAELLR